MNLNNILQKHLKSSINDETRSALISFVGQVDHGKSTFFDKLTNKNVRKGEAYDITQNLYYSEYGNFLLMDAPGHESFTFMKDNVLQISDAVLYFVSPFEATKDIVQKTIEQLRLCSVSFFVILTKLDVYKKESDKLMEKLAFLNLLPKELGGDMEMYVVNYGHVDINAINDIRCLSAFDIIQDIQETLSLFDINAVKGNLLYCVDKVSSKKLGDIHMLVNFMRRDIKVNQVIDNMTILKLFNENVPVQSSNSILLFARVSDISLGDMVHDTKSFSISKVEPLARRKDALLTIAIFAYNETRTKVVREYIEKQDWSVEIAFESSGQPDNLVLGDISARKGILIFFGILSAANLKHMKEARVNVIHSEDFHTIQEELQQQYALMKKNLDFEELKNSCVAIARIKKVFNIKKDVIAGCDVLQGIITKDHIASIVRGKDVIASGLKISSMKIKLDSVQLANRGEEVGLVLNTDVVFKEADRILFNEKIA